MTHDPMVPWRDRPPGGAADEDRAAALTRDVVAADGFAAGLDDRQLLAIEENLDLNKKRRARPPLWLRPALVAGLLTISLASAIGYERGWLAPLRERLRFRSIPAAVPAPAEPPKRHAARPAAAPPSDESPARPETPAPEAATAGSEALQTSPPVAPRAAAAKSAVAPAPRKVAVADTSPPPVPAGGDHAPTSTPPPPSEEIQALERAIGLLRGKHDAPAALAALDGYIARFPGGALLHEARVARIDALLMLDRADEALRALDALPLDAHRRSTELQLIRAELRARTDCARADVDFTAVLARVRTAALEERALYGRAACRTSVKSAGAADDLRRYVDRFPNGAHADWARRWLQNNH